MRMTPKSNNQRCIVGVSFYLMCLHVRVNSNKLKTSSSFYCKTLCGQSTNRAIPSKKTAHAFIVLFVMLTQDHRVYTSHNKLPIYAITRLYLHQHVDMALVLWSCYGRTTQIVWMPFNGHPSWAYAWRLHRKYQLKKPFIYIYTYVLCKCVMQSLVHSRPVAGSAH